MRRLVLVLSILPLVVLAAPVGREALAAPPGSLELVGHSPLLNRGMHAALAVAGNYAYVGNRSDETRSNLGVLVVDISNPAAPRVTGQIGPPNEGNIGESSRELRIWPEQNLLMVLNHGCSAAIHRCVGGEAIVRSTIRFYDISGENAGAPKLVSTYLPSRSSAQIPHEFFLWDDPKRPGRALLYLTTPTTGDRENLIVTDISGARQGDFKEVTKFTVRIEGPGPDDRRLHSLAVSNDGTRGYLAYLGGGFLIADTSDLAAAAPNPQIKLVTPVANRVYWSNPGAHSAVKLFGRDWALVTDEVYGKLGGVLAEHGCPWGWTRLIDIADPTKPAVRSEYRVFPYNAPAFCQSVTPDRDNFSSFSSHNPTLTASLAFISWHSAGLQAVLLRDPARPTQAAEFVPEHLPAVETEDPALSQGPDKVVIWSYPIIKNGLIYVVDIRNGLYVLRYRGPFAEEVSRTGFLEGNSNLGDALRFEPVPGVRPPPPPTPPRGVRRCLRRSLSAGTGGIGRARIGQTRLQLIRALGPPAARTRRAYRYCVQGGGRLLIGFSPRARAVLVASTAPGHRARGVGRGSSARAVRRAFPRLRRVRRGIFAVGSRSRALLFNIERGRVRFVGAAGQLAGDRGRLDFYLRAVVGLWTSPTRASR